MSGENHEDDCFKLLMHYEQVIAHEDHKLREEGLREDAELFAAFAVFLLAVACAVFQVALDIAEAIVATPTIGMLGFHKRHAIVRIARRMKGGGDG